MSDVVIDDVTDGPVPFTFKLCWKTDASGRLRPMHCQQPTAHCGGGEGGVQVGRTKRALERGACEILTSCADLTPRR